MPELESPLAARSSANVCLRDVVAGPDHCAYLLTNNRDTRGTPQAGDDHLYQLCPS
jgi:hypothetical protein